jgi:hypothetical protein
MISENAAEWLGLPVSLFDPEKLPSNYAHQLYRLALDWESELSFSELFARFLEGPACSETPALIIGSFAGDGGNDSSEIVQLIVAARRQLPKLRGIFLGDITSEENEISWINQSDVSPIFSAYPDLEHFRVRGGTQLSFGGRLRSDKLKSLTVESGGLPATVLREIASCDFPSLEHLELWLGTDEYGGDATLDDIRPFLGAQKYPRLKYLGLRDSAMADEVAKLLQGATILDAIETLDLSLGTLGDEGAEALLANQAVHRLAKVDLHHHYLSDEMMAKVKAALPQADLSDQEEEEEYGRFVAVSE